MMNVDLYIARTMVASVPVSIIAAKVGMTEEQVKTRWEALRAEGEKQNENGFVDLLQAFDIMANQYQLLGFSLAHIQKYLAGAVGPGEIEMAILGKTATAASKDLCQKYIVLKRFEPMSPEEALKQMTGDPTRGN